MKSSRTLCGSAIIIFGLSGYSPRTPQILRSTVRVHGEPVHVTLAADRFDHQGHDFKRGSNGEVLVDGIRAIGTDSFNPQRHLSRFEVDWNGRGIRIPNRFFEFVFDPSLQKKTNSFDDKGSVLVLASETEDSVMIMISGGDGAGTFNGWWIIQKNGRINRFNDGPP
jgi:hypothetical protein